MVTTKTQNKLSSNSINYVILLTNFHLATLRFNVLYGNYMLLPTFLEFKKNESNLIDFIFRRVQSFNLLKYQVKKLVSIKIAVKVFMLN